MKAEKWERIENLPPIKFSGIGEVCCGEVGPDGYLCGLVKGHSGEHIATDGTYICERWAAPSPEQKNT